MSIKDDLLTAKNNTRCGVRTFLESVSRELKIEYLEALQEARISAPALSAHMAGSINDAGEAPSAGMIKTHRRGECSCVDQRRTTQ